MRFLAGLVVLSFRIWAQGPVIARGCLLESDTGATGEFSIRAQNNRVYWYVYDTKTYVERDDRLTTVAKLHKGDEIEIVSDTVPDATLRYARTVHVVQSPAENQAQQKQFSLGRYAMPRHPIVHEDPLQSELFFPRGTLTFAGLVSQLNEERFVLRTRTDGEQTIYRRADTRYMKDGGVVEGSSLRLNMRVYVRGSKNLDGEIEAYQVIWGRIVETDPAR